MNFIKEEKKLMTIGVVVLGIIIGVYLSLNTIVKFFDDHIIEYEVYNFNNGKEYTIYWEDFEDSPYDHIRWYKGMINDNGNEITLYTDSTSWTQWLYFEAENFYDFRTIKEEWRW